MSGHDYSPAAMTDAIVPAEHVVRVSGSPDYLDEIIAEKK